MLVPINPPCRKCGRPAPAGSVEELFALGWGDGATLCPACRAERNARAARTAGRIASGLAAEYAERWGPGSRTVEVREIPSMATRSVWVAGPGETLHGLGAHDVWRELGDGAYLMSLIAGAERIYIVVDVSAGKVDMEPIEPDQVALLPALAQAMEEDHPDVITH